MGKLNNLEPTEVFQFFEEITQIPRGSGKEEGISNYLVAFAKEKGLEVYQDKAWNVIIKKAGTKGYENSEPVILQGHMDIVWEKRTDVKFDFETEGINLVIKDGFISAEGTTLGADNGIALAYILAILKSDTIQHPPLEVVITSDEEAGMNGAKTLDYSLLTAKRLINLDSEEEGFVYSGCAGGMRAKMTVPITWSKVPWQFNAMTISIEGLKGGHSGSDIHLQRANANKLMGRLLNQLMSERLIWIREINGGKMDNAIAHECKAVVCYDPTVEGTIRGICEAFELMTKKEYAMAEDSIKVVITLMDELPAMVFSYITAVKVVAVMMLIPNGVKTISLSIENLVESSNNLGIVRTDKETGEVIFTCATRSSVATRKELIREEMKSIADLCGADFEVGAQYPAWEFDPNSKLRNILMDTYKQMYNKDMRVEAIHAGLECGLFSEKLPNCDMVSIGPNMSGVHSPDEKLDIDSTKRTWEYLQEVLKNLK